VAGVSESASDARVEVRLGTEADALAAARLHSGSITEGFLAALGPRFLARLYRRIVTSPDAFLLVADGHRSSGGDGTTAGFIAGALDLGALYRRFIVRDGLAATLSALPQLLHSWPQAWETLRHGTTTDATTSDSQSGAAELLAIAVDPLWRGRHVGSQLVDGFLAELDRRSVDRAPGGGGRRQRTGHRPVPGPRVRGGGHLRAPPGHAVAHHEAPERRNGAVTTRLILPDGPGSLTDPGP
jgi:ribosomal protein S18 acetylase RimI-like enzyme